MTDRTETLIDATQSLTAATDGLVQALAAFSEAAEAMRPMASPPRTKGGPEFVFPAAPTRPQLTPVALRTHAAQHVLARLGGFLSTWTRSDLLDPRIPNVNLDLAVAKALDRIVEPSA
jgi:hypothetical protein